MKCADAEWVLAIQDTTSVGFGDRKAIQGMGYYCSTEQRGMLIHPCIAVTGQGIPLGVIYQETTTREERKDDGKKIFNELRSSPVAGSMVVRMSRNPKEHTPSRNVKMDYHCKEVVLHRPQRRRERHLQERIMLAAIYVHESSDEEEWKVLYCCARKTKEVPETYPLKEAVYDLGILGGMKGAPSDGMPGARSIWQGLEVLCPLLAYRNYLV